MPVLSMLCSYIQPLFPCQWDHFLFYQIQCIWPYFRVIDPGRVINMDLFGFFYMQSSILTSTVCWRWYLLFTMTIHACYQLGSELDIIKTSMWSEKWNTQSNSNSSLYFHFFDWMIQFPSYLQALMFVSPSCILVVKFSALTCAPRYTLPSQ